MKNQNSNPIENDSLGGASVSKFKSLRYPKEIGTNEVPAFVRFVPKKVNYGGTEGIEANNLSVGSSRKGGLQNKFYSDVKGSVDSFATSVRESINSKIGSFISGSIKIGDFDIALGTKTKPDTLTSEGSISLYLPEALQTTTNASYSATDTGNLGKAIVDNSLDGTTSLSDLGRLSEGAVLDGVKAAVNNIDSLKSGIAISKGLVANNYSFQIFDGVEHRSFSYEFNLVARSDKDSLEIKEICDTFLFYLLPEKDTSSDIGFFRVPAMWEIKYYYKDKDMDFHQQPVGHCFLTSVDVGYGGESQNNLYNNSAPMNVTLTLNFTEIEPMYRGKA